MNAPAKLSVRGSAAGRPRRPILALSLAAFLPLCAVAQEVEPDAPMHDAPPSAQPRPEAPGASAPAEENGAAARSGGQASPLERHFAELADPENPHWSRAQSDIQREWSRSGSAAMDLLLKRGERALDEGDAEAAIEHLTALLDHAPDFAEGYHARAAALYMTGRVGPAMEDLAHALSLEPRHWSALAGLGMILDEMGHRDRALEAMRASLEIHPHQRDVSDNVKRLERSLDGVRL